MESYQGMLCDPEPPSCPSGYVCARVASPSRCRRVEGAQDGVTANEIRIGTSAGYLTGGNVPIASSVVTGIQTYVQQVNAAGGIHGRKLVLDLRDDGNDPSKAADNTYAMLTPSRTVFALLGYVGDPGVAASYPIALENHVPFFGAVARTPEAIRSPPDRYAFAYRGGYATNAAVEWLLDRRQPKINPRNIAIFAQGTDSLGRDTCSWDAQGFIHCEEDPAVYEPGMNKMDLLGRPAFDDLSAGFLVNHGIPPNQEIFATHTRNMVDVENAVDRFLHWLARPKAPGERYQDGTFDAAIVLQAVTDPAVALVVALRDAIAQAKEGATAVGTLTAQEITELSKIGELAFAGALLGRPFGDKLAQMASHERYCDEILAIQVVPHPAESEAPLVAKYRHELATYYPSVAPDVFSLEGYIAARLFGAGLEVLGPDITAEAFVDILESMVEIDLDLGIPAGARFGFTDTSHLARSSLWGSKMDPTTCGLEYFDLHP